MKKQPQRNSIRGIGIWGVIVLCILAIPFFTMAPWTIGDYLFAGSVLFGAGVLYEVLARRMKNNLQRIVVGGALLFLILLIWAWAVA